MLELLNQRRTIRKYKSDGIAPEFLMELLNAAAQASNTGNMQAYSVIVTTNHEIKQQLAPAHFNQPMVVNAPAVLTFCADFNRVAKWCKVSKAEPGFDNFESFMSAAADALIFAQTFCVAAESEGLGICYLGTATYNAQEIIEALNLPSLVIPVATVTVGYPELVPPLTDRLPLEAVVHIEKYADFSDEYIQHLYAEKESDPQYQQFVVDNNKETLAQVFTDVRYTKKNNEFFSEKYLLALKQQGFLK